ncbi:MAG: three-Cys-motif partner protein TcmP [Deltaproteobacteria bacterium]|nr:three-Cys-motif partner protein TcmP [Deltaproteobacteria bacterium]
MSKPDRCVFGGPTKPNGNCTVAGDDGLPVQCVGPWAKDKHDYLRRYVEATKAARSKFLTPSGGRPAGGAAYVELFAGPGRARIRTSGELIPGSPFIAIEHAGAPFSRIVLAERDKANVAALLKRTDALDGRVRIVSGDCNERIDEIVAQIPEHGLNIALVDPYGLGPLRFQTLRKLASMKRMDLVIHFPTMDIKRNLGRAGGFITRFLGTERWRDVVKKPEDVVKLVEILRSQLAAFGYEQEKVRDLPIKQSTNAVMYHLIYATKDRLGNKIWDTIARTTAQGQRGLF